MYDPGELYTDPILTNFSLGFPDQEMYGVQIMPIVPVNTKSARYRVFDRSDWMIFPSRREPGTEAHEIRGRKWSEDTFMTQEHSLQSPIHDEERQQLNSLGGLANPAFGGALQIQPERDATNLVTRSILLEHEVVVSALVRDTATYPVANTVTLAGAQQWDDWTFVTPGDVYSIVSDPVGDLRAASNAIWGATRRRPNTLAIPVNGLWVLENHPRVVARFSNFDFTMPDAFRRLFGFDGKILLTDSMYNSADNIDATPVMTDLWGKDVWLGIVEPSLSQNEASFGKTFSQIYPNGSLRPVDRWREEKRKSDIVRASQSYDPKVVWDDAGYLIKNAFSAGAF